MSRVDRDLQDAGERRRRRLIIAPIVVVAVLVLGVFAYARLSWNAWPWQYSPGEISACGRHYLRGDVVSKAKLDADREHLVEQGTVGVWGDHHTLWAEDSSEGVRVTRAAAGCSTVMWIQESSDSYRSYAIEGGL